MFRCERCGSNFNPTVVAAVENCPRCKGRDGIAAPLTFKLFSLPADGSRRSGRAGATRPSR